jgi:acyl dehydratase
VGDHASEERTFTEKEVFQFSDICGDKNLIHIDENYGKSADLIFLNLF